MEDQNQYFCCGRQWVKPVLNQCCTSTAAFLASFFFFFFDFYSSEASGGNLHTQEVAVITTLRGASELFAKGSELC